MRIAPSRSQCATVNNRPTTEAPNVIQRASPVEWSGSAPVAAKGSKRQCTLPRSLRHAYAGWPPPSDRPSHSPSFDSSSKQRSRKAAGAAACHSGALRTVTMLHQELSRRQHPTLTVITRHHGRMPDRAIRHPASHPKADNHRKTPARTIDVVVRGGWRNPSMVPPLYLGCVGFRVSP